MKRITTTLVLICLLCLGLHAQIKTVQGVPRKDIHTVNESLDNYTKLDLDKVKFVTGEGDNISLLVVEWGDGKGVEKMVWGYRWNTPTQEEGAKMTPTGEDLLRAIAAADPRFYVMIEEGTAYGSAIGGIGFDLNGNRDLAFTVNGNDTRYEVNEEGLLLASGYGFDDYIPTDPLDHWCGGWYSGYFSYYTSEDVNVEPEYSSVGATGRSLKNNSVDYWKWSSLSGESFPTTDYYFYTPLSEKGYWTAAEFDCPLSDEGGFVPTMIDLYGEKDLSFKWNVTLENGKKDNSIVKNVTSSAKALNGQVTFANNGKLGTVYAEATATMGEEQFTSKCILNVVAPTKPIKSFTFEKQEVEAGLKQKVENPFSFVPNDATYTGWKLESDNKEVAFINGQNEIMTKTTEGTAKISVVSLINPEVRGEFTLNVKCQQPVESIDLGSDSIVMVYKDIYSPKAIVLPENADYQDIEYSIEDPSVASFYQANIVAHKVGRTTLTATAKDGKGASVTIPLIVNEQDRTPYEGYQDGTFLLNEAWFGHENGSMNFLTKEKEVMYRVYERENPGMAFGATSCYGMIYGGKFFVASKQEADGGDSNPGGGRLVVFDAKTLKHIKGFDQVGGGDGRALVGVTPEKIYVGTTQGIIPLNTETLELGEAVEGTVAENAYNGQVGDMVKVGNYVFAIVQSKGTLVIDAENDIVKTCLEDANIQGIAQSADGNVWLASSTELKCVDPATLEVIETQTLPEGTKLACAWGAWKPTAFCASRTKNVLYWNISSGWDNGSDFYRYEIGQDNPAELKPFFTLKGLAGNTENDSQVPYGTIRYDDRSDELVVMTTQGGWGTNYEYNWIHLVNGTTGEINKSLPLKQYYWFQGMPVFPDKYAPELELEEVLYEVTADSEPIVIDLKEKATDKDNLACNIRVWMKDAGNAEVADSKFANDTLTITPVAEGVTSVAMAVESNGVVTEKEIEVRIAPAVGIDWADQEQQVMYENGEIRIVGCEGYEFVLCSIDGKQMTAFRCDSNDYVVSAFVNKGVYVLRALNSERPLVKKIAAR